MNHNLLNLLSLLQDTDFKSGVELSEKLAVSRATINSYVKKLQKYGLDIYCVKGKGYKLANTVRLIDKDGLRAKLCAEFSAMLPEHIYYKEIISSTNTHLMTDNVSHGSVAVCVAEYQAGGRGRQGKSWYSNLGSDMTLSIKYPFSIPLQKIAGLSLAVGVELAKIVESYCDQGAEISLKWPNDLYINQKKVAGILIEILGDIHGNNNVVIGIGCNVYSVKNVEQPTTSMHLFKKHIDRQALIEQTCVAMIKMCQNFENSGFASYVSEWRSKDYLFGKNIAVKKANETIYGIGKGVDHIGGYKVQLDDGSYQTVHGGEISLKVNQ